MIKKKKSKKVLFAGKIAKPNFSSLRLDFKGIYILLSVIWFNIQFIIIYGFHKLNIFGICINLIFIIIFNLLPFLFIFAVVFGILNKTKVFAQICLLRPIFYLHFYRI